MIKRTIYIFIVNPSVIICKGVAGILHDSGLPHRISIFGTLREVEEALLRSIPDIALINPVLIHNQVKEFKDIRAKYADVSWIGISYLFPDQQILSMLDEVIYINDTPQKLLASVQKKFSDKSDNKFPQESLSERETEVLKLLVSGKANKTIADMLNISTHTVITHRKNVSRKTGIKSLSGLTIYAVLKGVISIDDYKE